MHLRSLLLVCLLLSACASRPKPKPVLPRPDLGPGSFRLPTIPAREVLAASLRVYVDAEYQAIPGWRGELERLFEDASAVLGPTFGVQLVPAAFTQWKRTAADGDLRAMLEELEKSDPGEGTDWVVGVTGAQTAVTANVEVLGQARLLSRHLVLRRITHPPTPKSSRVEKEEREANRRDAHKRLVVLLHEWAHTLGAVHLSDSETVMSPSLSTRQRTFGEEAEGLIRISLQHPAARWFGPEAEAAKSRRNRELAKFVTDHPQGDWAPGEVAEFLEILGPGEPDPAAEPAAAAPAGPTKRMRPGDAAAWNSAHQALADGRAEDAWRLVHPLATHFESDFETQDFSCEIASFLQVPFEGTRTACERALALQPESAATWLSHAWVLSRSGEQDQARSAVARAATGLEKTPAATPHNWSGVCRLARRLELPGLAEQAAGSALPEDREEILPWAQDVRRRTGMPRGLAPADQPRYLAAYKSAEAALAQGRLPELERKLAAMPSEFRGASGLLALRCGLAASLRREEEARSLCQRALAADEECLQAHYFLGLLDSARRKDEAAATHFRRITVLVPAIEAGWVQLGLALRRLDRTAEFEDLDRRFRARFGRPLPRRQ